MGIPAKSHRIVLGSLMLQRQYGCSDWKLLEQISGNLYYQYFIGLPGLQNEPLFIPSLLVEFRKRLDDEVMM